MLGARRFVGDLVRALRGRIRSLVRPLLYGVDA